MTQNDLKTKIDQLTTQREQLLMQLGGVNAAIAVYQEWLKDYPAHETTVPAIARDDSDAGMNGEGKPQQKRRRVFSGG